MLEQESRWTTCLADCCCSWYLSPPLHPHFLCRVLPYPIPDPTASYRFGGSLTVLRTEQPDAMALPAATERLRLGISADDQLLHGSALSAFKPFAGSIAFDSADRSEKHGSGRVPCSACKARCADSCM